MRWLCLLGWHTYSPWRIVRRRFIVLIEYATGNKRILGGTLTERRQCRHCGQKKYRDVVLDYRRRYGGEKCAEEPWPQHAADRFQEYQERCKQRREESPVLGVKPCSEEQ